jgi:hypothetical protein
MTDMGTSAPRYQRGSGGFRGVRGFFAIASLYTGPALPPGREGLP